MFYATCHGVAGFVPAAGRCGELLTLHGRPEDGGTSWLVYGVWRGQSVPPGAVCQSLVCSVCGACQGGLRQDAA